MNEQLSKQILLFCVLLIVPVLCSCESKQKDGACRAKSDMGIEFSNKKRYFMNVDSTTTLSTSFYFQNNTDQKQYIDTVKTACGCTKVSYPHYMLSPGQCDSIVVDMDISDVSGYFSKPIVAYFHNCAPVVLKVMGKKENEEERERQ